MSNVAREKLSASEAGEEASPVSGARPFLLIQVLRGIAALMVVWHHATLMENERLDPARGVWLSGAGGVDIFFVISGFVMVLSSRSLCGAVHPVRIFLQRRIDRVVPMYWIVTTVKLGIALSLPALAPNVLNGLWHVIASYLFLPSLNAAGAIHPVLIVGWTLNFEAAFYVMVALGLGLRLPLVPFLLTLLAALGFAGWVLRGSLPVILSQINPLLLEFGYGVLLTGILPLLRVRRRWGAVLYSMALLAGFAVIQINPQEVVRTSRPFVWGLAAMVIVGSALALEDQAGKWMPGWLLQIGNASYTNYLIHTLVLAVLGFLWSKKGTSDHAGWIVGTMLCVVACAIAAEIGYRFVEMPATAWVKGKRSRRVRFSSGD